MTAIFDGSSGESFGGILWVIHHLEGGPEGSPSRTPEVFCSKHNIITPPENLRVRKPTENVAPK